MEIIHYLNHTAQLFNAAADIISSESAESASILRNLSSSRLFHSTHLWGIVGQTKQDGVAPAWHFSFLPMTLGLGNTVSDVIKSLTHVIEAEEALQHSPYVTTYPSQTPIFVGVIRASRVTVELLERIIQRLKADTDKYWVCQNCFVYTENRDNGCPCCGMGKNWLKPISRF